MVGCCEPEESILDRWRKSGKQLFSQLPDPFAIMLWDGDQLTAARDAGGNCPLHFAQNPEGPVFGQSPLAVAREIGDVTLDLKRLTSFAAALPESGSESFFRSVERIEAGQFIRWRDRKVVRKGWWWKPDLTVRRRSRSDAVETLDAMLKRSIDHLSTSVGRPALMLSSGIDSNILLSRLASSDRPLIAVTGGPERQPPQIKGFQFDERETAARSAATFPSVEHFGPPGPSTWVRGLSQQFERYHRPYYNPSNIGWMDAVYGQVAHSGADLLVHGLQGNFTVSRDSHGEATQALSTLDVAAFLRAIVPRRGGVPAIRSLVSTVRDLAPTFITRRMHNRSGWELARQWFLNPDHPSFEAALDEERARGVLPYPSGHRCHRPEEQLRQLVQACDMGLYNWGIERAFGYSLRDPFSSREIIEYCLSLPSSMFREGDHERVIGKRLLDRRIPDDIRENEIEGRQGMNWQEAATEQREEALALVEWTQQRHGYGDVFDTEALREILIDWPASDEQLQNDASRRRIGLGTALTAISFAKWVDEEALS